MRRVQICLLMLLTACGKPAAPPAAPPTPRPSGPAVRGTVLQGGEPFEGVRVRAEGIVRQGLGGPRIVAAGETVSAKDGSFEIVLSKECLEAFNARTSWGWSVNLRAEHPECFRAIVTPSHIDTWEECSNVTVAFPDVSEDIAAEMKTLFEEFRKNPARTTARVGLEPAEWDPHQELFDSIVDAVGGRRAARTLVKTYEKDVDPHVRALAYEALGVVGDSEDDVGRVTAGDDASARALLEWCYRDVERSKHGGHYGGGKLDDGCTRCYARWEDAASALWMMRREESGTFLAGRKGLKGQAAGFHALLTDEFRRTRNREDHEKEKGPLGWLPDFDLSATLKPDETVLVYYAHLKPWLVGPNRLDTPVAFTPDWFTLGEFAWSPDGKRLAGQGGAFHGSRYGIWILDLEKGKASRATWGASVDWRPAWLPDNRRLLFARNGVKGQLWMVDGSTYESRKLDSADDFLDHFSIHPDGTRVAVGYRGGTAYVLDLATGRKSPLVSGGGPVHQPAWSPTGDRLAISRDKELHILEPGGSPSRLSPEGLKLQRLAWSPDGAWIAFTYFKSDDEAGFAVVKPDGTGFRELRKTRGWPAEDAPTWASDSTRVALGARESGATVGELWIFPVPAGAGFRLIEGDAADAAWRPVK